MAYARGKIGSCVVVQKSDKLSNFERTFIFAIGGVEEKLKTSKLIERYNVIADVWQPMPELKEPRANSSSLVLSDYLYIFGGI